MIRFLLSVLFAVTLLTQANLGFCTFSLVGPSDTDELNLWVLSSAGYSYSDTVYCRYLCVAVITVQCFFSDCHTKVALNLRLNNVSLCPSLFIHYVCVCSVCKDNAYRTEQTLDPGNNYVWPH